MAVHPVMMPNYDFPLMICHVCMSNIQGEIDAAPPLKVQVYEEPIPIACRYDFVITLR